VGVFSLELARLYAYLYQQTEKQFLVVHALDGYDEVSLTGPFKIITAHSEHVLSPSHLGLDIVRPESLSGGGTIAEAAQIFMNVLNDESTLVQKQAVIANAALALYTIDPTLALHEAVAIAKESVESKKALDAFKKLVAA
jgi:anthranilate phosphoribosyltransferase